MHSFRFQLQESWNEVVVLLLSDYLHHLAPSNNGLQITAFVLPAFASSAPHAAELLIVVYGLYSQDIQSSITFHHQAMLEIAHDHWLTVALAPIHTSFS